MYDHTLHGGRKNFCRRFCLQTFSKEGILKSHIKVCFKINGKQRIKIPKKGEYVKLEKFVPENNGKQNPDGSYSTEYQKYVVCN